MTLSAQVGPTATQAMHEFLTRLQVHLSSTCPQMFSEFLLKLVHILSTERYTLLLFLFILLDSYGSLFISLFTVLTAE